MAISELLRVRPGAVDLAAYDADGQPGFEGGKKDGKKAVEALAPRLAEMQEKLFADGYTDGSRSLLLVIQGMDTSGKGGVLKHCVGLFDPGGVRIKSFKKPTKEELSHDFLWRIEKETPAHGYVGIFDRSHYEDVLVVKVHELADAAEVDRRYDAINAFEQRLVDQGTTVVKCMLHISNDEQRDRLLARLEDPTKQWKYKPDDVNERMRWEDYQRAYEVALERCSTDAAPWHVVPGNKKWYRTWAISTLLTEALEAMQLDWPAPSYDVEGEKKRVAAT
jgi:PPK2 family polyphosphate:nucleotide phosphotransferase